jgi:predicted transcriptional regulator
MMLGELEKRVLHHLWQQGMADAKQVHEALRSERGGSLNTIQSTLDRLYKKGLLSRQKQGHAYIYSPGLERDALLAQLIEQVTSDFVADGEHGLVAAFASLSAQLDDDHLDLLERMIEQQRERRGQGGSDAAE